VLQKHGHERDFWCFLDSPAGGRPRGWPWGCRAVSAPIVALFGWSCGLSSCARCACWMRSGGAPLPLPLLLRPCSVMAAVLCLSPARSPRRPPIGSQSSDSCRSGPSVRGLAARLLSLSPSCGKRDASAAATASKLSACHLAGCGTREYLAGMQLDQLYNIHSWLRSHACPLVQHTNGSADRETAVDQSFNMPEMQHLYANTNGRSATLLVSKTRDAANFAAVGKQIGPHSQVCMHPWNLEEHGCGWQHKFCLRCAGGLVAVGNQAQQ
jgi:hypothetical protein